MRTEPKKKKRFRAALNKLYGSTPISPLCCAVASWERMLCYTQHALVCSKQDIRAQKRASASVMQTHDVADVCVRCACLCACDVAATLCCSLPTATYELLLMFSLSGIPVGRDAQGSFVMCAKENVIQQSVPDRIPPRGNWKGHTAVSGSPRGPCVLERETRVYMRNLCRHSPETTSCAGFKPHKPHSTAFLSAVCTVTANGKVS